MYEYEYGKMHLCPKNCCDFGAWNVLTGVLAALLLVIMKSFCIWDERVPFRKT